ncbi:Sorting nexin-41, partial [Pichia californica]
MDYDDFSHDNNPFAGSNHYYSNGINDMIISSNNNDDDNNNNDDNADNDNDNLIETSSILNDDIDNNTSYDFANNTTTSLPISISEQPTLYLPINDNNNKNNEINQLLNSPYIIKSFEIGKDFKGSKTVFYKIENIINKTFTLRRYNDFKSLRNYLCKFYPYLFIPPIPEKHSISRFLKNPFNYKNDLSIIELRIRLLNYFLFKINLNNKLSNSQIMIKFLDPLINNWLNCLKFPPFTNLSSNSILL